MRTKRAFVPSSLGGIDCLEDRVVLSHGGPGGALTSGLHAASVGRGGHGLRSPAQVAALSINCVQQLIGFRCIPRDPGTVFTDPVTPTNFAIDVHNRSTLKVGLTFKWSISAAPISTNLPVKFHRVFKLTTTGGVAPSISFDRSTAPGIQLQTYKLPVKGGATTHYYFRTINSSTIGLFST